MVGLASTASYKTTQKYKAGIVRDEIRWDPQEKVWVDIDVVQSPDLHGITPFLAAVLDITGNDSFGELDVLACLYTLAAGLYKQRRHQGSHLYKVRLIILSYDYEDSSVEARIYTATVSRAWLDALAIHVKTTDLSEVFSLGPNQQFLPSRGVKIERSAWIPLDGDVFSAHHFDNLLERWPEEKLARTDSLDLQPRSPVLGGDDVVDARRDQTVESDAYSVMLNAMLEPLHPLFAATTDASDNGRKRSSDEVD
ncbi:hypothetical protein LTS18_012688 [Coniosporium uncinatum]|uniref:Uncharacterized protein n=1 Tax=Coniosporium uncinatum TaxID=93489 RepID=A0ACC3CX78_9PEZI|nr:hypothetical protein LTS18_012688 [Coniosporium uncinatum]